MTTVSCAPTRRSPVRDALRLMLAGGAVVVALLLFAGRAHADTTPASTSGGAASTPTSTPAAGPGPGSPDTTGSSPATGSTPPPTVDPSRKISASTAPLPPPTGKAPSPASGTAGDAAGTPTPVKRDDTQNSDVANTGVATAVSGANTAVGSTSQTPPAGAPPAAGPANGSGTVGTGNANAQGVDANTSITQQVSAQATGQGKIHVVQIGLIVDVGVAEANSGHNYVRVALSPLEGTASATVDTGNVTVVGARGTTGITQSAKITNGQTAGQQAFVVNIGIAFGDSGSNVALVGATISRNGQTAIAAGKVTTGDAQAIGDRSSSAIGQTATLAASDHGVLTVDQRAVIVNVGIALANSGFNTAGVGSLSAAEDSVVQSILTMLFGGSGLPALNGFTGSSSGGTAGISTGNVVAIGNDTRTGIGQSVNGSVSGHGTASASQLAYVTNLGIAVGNSGGNLAGVLGLSPGAGNELATTQASTLSFLDQILHPGWLVDQGSSPQLMSAVDLGGALLQVRGDVTGTMQLLGIPGPDGSDGTNVSIEQVSGVLHLSFAFANTGRNTAAVADQAGGAQAGGLLAAIGTEVAGITTGNVNAVGGDFTVDVCQSIGDHACEAPPVPVKAPTPQPGATPPTMVLPLVVTPEGARQAVPTRVEAATVTSTLPFTGAGSVPEEVLAAVAAIGIGVATQLRRRRRNPRTLDG